MTETSPDTSWKERWPADYAKNRSPMVTHYRNVDSPIYGMGKILNTPFDEGKGMPLYRNEHWQFTSATENKTPTLPTDAGGAPKLPPNTAVAIVGHNCKWCKNYMAMNDYPTNLPEPDGRKILYVDIHDSAQAEYISHLGYSGPGSEERNVIRGALGVAVDVANKMGLPEKWFSRSMLDIMLGKPIKFNGKQAVLPNGTKVNGGSFPVLLETDGEGTLSNVLSAGLVGTANLFRHIRGEKLIDITAELKSKAPLSKDEQVMCTVALLGGCMQWHGENLVLALGCSSPSDADMAKIKTELGIENAKHSWDKKLGFYIVIPKERQDEIIQASGLSNSCSAKDIPSFP